MVKVCEQTYPKDSVYNEQFQKYPFPLSPFQKHAIEAIIEGHHVLVTAHTGSGKTLPAEFAIDHFTGKGKKVIYTSPIKALSNQKYYEFTQKFPSVSIGLFTGDIKTNPEADVLIMTTEILMNTLFNHVHNHCTENSTQMTFQMDFENELSAVVFDEVHYINDECRGQVWEKCLMMLPSHVQKIMLSATIDNPTGFAQWCEDAHPNSGKLVYVSTTSTRVVPLSHYGFMIVGDSNMKTIKDKSIQQELRKTTNQLIPLQNEKGAFDPTTRGYNNLLSIQKHISDFKFFLKRKFVLNQLTSFLKDKNMLPAIAFVFSRKNVELYAREITVPLLEDDSKIPYTVQRECDQIIRRLPNSQEYFQLPEYISLVKLLEKGIGIHHSGMIPILREIVELCISKKYIKLLFATESFAIGLDCPIRTVVFTSVTKFDGNTDRYLQPHEYTQMAGRAGRRGIDTVGHVVHCNNLFKLPDRGTYVTMLKGKAPNLISKFRVGYELILNVLKTAEEKENDEDQMSLIRSFIEKSMLYIEISGRRAAYQSVIDSSDINIQWNRDTPEDICTEYLKLKKDEPRTVNKKRKALQKRLNEIEMEYEKCLKRDLEYCKMKESRQVEYQQNLEYIKSLDEEIPNTVNKVCHILQSKGYIDTVNDKWRMTPLGEFASHIAEVNPLLWAICIMEKWNYFEGFTVKQIVGLLSCTTNIKVSPEIMLSVPKTEDEFLKNKILEMVEIDVEFQTFETNMGVQVRREEDDFMYDIIDDAMKWCDCNSEEECKLFISTSLSDKGISTGDFAKGMLKIATISRELSTLGNLEFCKDKVEWLNKLSQIEPLILKYIVTNQSLYV